MTLQSSGQISMSQINTELGRSSTATISLDTAENGGYATINTNSSSRPSSGNPAAMSEWYSYNHNASPPCIFIGSYTDHGAIDDTCCYSYGSFNVYGNGNLTLNTTTLYTNNTCTTTVQSQYGTTSLSNSSLGSQQYLEINASSVVTAIETCSGKSGCF